VIFCTGDKATNLERKEVFEKQIQEKYVEGTPILPIIVVVVFVTLVLGVDVVSEFLVGY